MSFPFYVITQLRHPPDRICHHCSQRFDFKYYLCSLSYLVFYVGPQEQTVSQITDFQKLFLSAGFLAYAGVLIAISLSIIFYFGPKYVFIFIFSHFILIWAAQTWQKEHVMVYFCL